MNDSTKIEKTVYEHDSLFNRVVELIETVRLTVSSTVNLAMVHTYFKIGKMRIEEEQKEKKRAAYGKSVLKELLANLTTKLGKGFSVENLDRMRFFYSVYSDSISSTIDEIRNAHHPSDLGGNSLFTFKHKPLS